MYKTASAWHAQGEQLMDALLEDDQEKVALPLGLLSGPIGNYYGEREGERYLREKGYSPSQIEAARSSTRGKAKASLSGLGYQVGGTALGALGGRAGLMVGSLAGTGVGGYRNYKIKKRQMLAKARELRGMDMEDGYMPRARKRKRR